MDILENKMKETARNDLNVEVAKGKTDFENGIQHEVQKQSV